MHRLLVNHLVTLAQEKNVVRLIDCFNMTLAVEKQANKIKASSVIKEFMLRVVRQNLVHMIWNFDSKVNGLL